MKKIVFLLIGFLPFFSVAQNVGIGTMSPLQKLHVNGGNFLIQEMLSQTNTAPTGAQTFTLLNGLSILVPPSDSTYRIYDPGGAAGNYLANLSCGSYAPASANCVGFEVTVNSIGLGTGDSLVISELSLWRNVLLAVGNNYSTTGTYTFNTPTLYFSFKSNSDASTGSGFNITVKKKYQLTGGASVENMAGNVLLYDTRWDRLQIGPYKINEQLGLSSFSGGTSSAYGQGSFAFGKGNHVYGQYAGAIGLENTVLTHASFALGWQLQDYGSANDNTIFLGKWNTSGSLPFSQQPVLIIGGGSPGSRSNAMEVYDNGSVYHSGYVQIGQNAPLIKTALITGYSLPSTDNAWTFIPAPAEITNMNKIVSLQVMVTNGIWQYIPNSTHPGSYFRTNIDQRNIAVGTFLGQSASLYGKPIKVFITYVY